MSRRSRARLVLAALVLAAPLGVAPVAGPGRAPDLDVAVPPGSPLDWSLWFPSLTPRPEPARPETGAAGGAAGAERTSAAPAGSSPSAPITSPFGLVRILTWDVAAHVSWIHEALSPGKGPVTGRPGRHPPLPQPGDALYWMSVAPLLRLLLHPQAVSHAETVAHLVEIGEPVLGVLPGTRGEPGLDAVATDLMRLIEPARDAAPAPRAPTGARARMLARFAFEELSTRFPHDPVGGFGERLFLLGEPAAVEVAAYLDDGNAFVRRNAAAALARYRSREALAALLDAAIRTDDPVVLVRALGGLRGPPGKLDAAPLVARLERTREPALEAALCAALGRMRVEAAVPRLLAIGGAALAAEPRDADRLIAVLSALAEMRPRDRRDAVLAFAERAQEDAQDDPRAYVSPLSGKWLAADTGDPMEMRAETVAQIALIVQARLDSDPRHARALLDLRAEKPSRNRAPSPVASRDSLAAVHPAARFLYLATLPRAGDTGVAALESVARDRASEASIRGFALAQLPFDRQVEVARALFDETDAPDVRIQALEVASRERHPTLGALARRALAETARLEPGGGPAEARWLGVVALRALGRPGELGAADLLPLCAHLRGPRSDHGDLEDEVRARAEELLRLARERAQQPELEAAADRLLDRAIAEAVNPGLDETTRERFRRDALALAASAAAHATDPLFQQQLAQSIADLVLGYVTPPAQRAQGEFVPRVQLEEEILLALGRCGDPAALEPLSSVLASRRNRWRGAACLALGALGRPGPERTLASFLLDPDPFVRLCAARALERLTGKASDVDWMYADGVERARAAEEVLAGLLRDR